MLDDQGMPDQWIIRVYGKEYGPADLETLREWKSDGRVVPTNEARLVESNSWATAADIPDLFNANARRVSGATHAGDFERVAADNTSLAEDSPWVDRSESRDAASTPPMARRSFFQIISETLRIFREGFPQFFGLTLLTAVPSLVGQFAGTLVETPAGTNLDLRTLLLGAFSFCMLLVTLVLWPIYIAGIQILSVERMNHRRISFFGALNEAVKYWPRVAMGWVFVYGVFFLLILFALGIALLIVVGANSLPIIFIALVLLVIQVWMFGRFFFNVLFWQQFAVLGNLGLVDAFRESKYLARSGHDLSWYRRPLWRGAFIVSLWTLFVLVIAVVSEWPLLPQYLKDFTTIQDPQVLLQKLSTASETTGVNYLTLGLNLFQRMLQPLLGIGFVVLYFDSRAE
jgi:hypothetical protein